MNTSSSISPSVFETFGSGASLWLQSSLSYSSVSSSVSRHIDFLLTPHGDMSVESHRDALFILFMNWCTQFVCSWIAFGIYMYWDYSNYVAKTLETKKLVTRHPLNPFWYSQLRMIPLVLYNQCVVWPLINILFIWPQWCMNMRPGFTAWGWSTVPCLLVLMLISDQMWYWSHRLMHTRYAWRNFHRLHHVAEQTAISATYVHPVEYAMFTIAMNLPFALTGFPVSVHSIPMGWGMFTGSGAHSGYSGDFANGDQHNGHHYFHNVNFGLLMVADMMFGTHWNPTDPPPNVWKEAIDIWEKYPVVHGSEEASAHKIPDASVLATKKAHGADADVVFESEEQAKRIELLRAGKRLKAPTHPPPVLSSNSPHSDESSSSTPSKLKEH